MFASGVPRDFNNETRKVCRVMDNRLIDVALVQVDAHTYSPFTEQME